jgi:PPM family protein phosphatase
LISLALLVVALGAAAFATTAWINNSWYVGNQDGSVTIFNGPRGEVIGMELSDVHQKTPLAVESLPEIDQVRLKEGITAKNRADAENVVRNLQAKVTPSPEPGPTPTPPPEPSPAAPAP